MNQLLKGAVTLLRFLVVGFKPVTEQLALSRSLACQRCVLNRTESILYLNGKVAVFKKDSLIRKVSRLIMRRVGITGYYTEPLGHCELCGCYLPMKIWVPPNKLNTSEEIMELKPSHCWLQ